MRRSAGLIDIHVNGGVDGVPVDTKDYRAMMLAQYITSDVQGSTIWAKELLEHLSAVTGMSEEPFEATGNAFTVHINADDVVIENAIFPEDPVAHITHEEFREALEVLVLIMDDYVAKRR